MSKILLIGGSNDGEYVHSDYRVGYRFEMVKGGTKESYKVEAFSKPIPTRVIEHKIALHDSINPKTITDLINLFI